MRVWLPLLIVALLAAPAQAGSSDDPEVTDSLEDDALGTGTDASNAMDIEYIFVQEEGTCGADHLYFEMKLANLLDDDQSSGPGASKEVTFALRGEEHVLVGEALTPAFTLDGEEVDGDIDNDLEIYYWCVPADMVGGLETGDVVDGIWGRTVHGGGEDTDVAPDDAPDETGRPYVIGAADTAEAALTVVAPNETVTAVEGHATFEVSVTNNASAEDTVHLSANATDGWNVTIEPANATLDAGGEAKFTVDLAAGDHAAANVTVRLRIASDLGFRDSVLLNATLGAPAGGDGDGDGDGGGGDGDGDGDGDGGGKDSPLGAWVLLAALAIAVARRR